MPTNKKFLTVSELFVDDKVIPLSTDPKEQAKTFTVTDLHPVKLGDDYKTVAVTLWDGWREFTSRTILFQLVERRY